MSYLSIRASARKPASKPFRAVVSARLVGPDWLTVGRFYRRNVRVFKLRRMILSATGATR